MPGALLLGLRAAFQKAEVPGTLTFRVARQSHKSELNEGQGILFMLLFNENHLKSR